MGEKMSRSRMWCIVTVILVACIVALGVGFGIALQEKNDKEAVDSGNGVTTTPAPCECEPPAPPSSARLTKDSPLYVQPTDIREGNYRHGAVASDSPICSVMGMDMILAGGSTVDAAITSITCNGVVHPQGSGIGGGFFMTYYKRSTSKSYAIMAREMAPGAANETMYVDGTISSRRGAMAAGIPGEVKGLYEAWKLGGKLPWDVLFKPVIKMCEDGFPVSKLLAYDIQANKEGINENPNLKSMLTNLATGNLLVEGDKLRLHKLAETLRKISNDPFTFYNGSLAEDIVLDIKEAGGIITTEDLNKYTAAVKNPLSIDLSFGEYTVLSPPPPSSGAVVLLILNILDGYNMGVNDLSTGAKGVETFHRIAEAFKHGFSVRTNLGDEDQEDQAFKDDIQELLSNMTSASWGAVKRSKILHDTQNTSYYEPTYASNPPDAGTAHVSVYGPDGDAVSVTSTINTYFGSMLVGNRTGIVFNNEMDDFSTPGVVNFFGVHASPANFIKPYKRPLSSMSPSIVLDKDGDVKLVTGSSGGTRIITSNALSIIHTIWLKLGMKEAIEYPRIHHQLLPPELRIEEAMPQVIKDGLEARGHVFDVRTKLGSSLQAVLVKNKTDNSVEAKWNREFSELYAYCDPVKYGSPYGV